MNAKSEITETEELEFTTDLEYSRTMNTIYALLKYGSDIPLEKSEHRNQLTEKRDRLNAEKKKDEKEYYVCIWLGRIQKQ